MKLKYKTIDILLNALIIISFTILGMYAYSMALAIGIIGGNI
jgi:hypothetical protein